MDEVIPQLEDELIKEKQDASLSTKIKNLFNFMGRGARVKTEEQLFDHTNRRVQIFVYKSRKINDAKANDLLIFISAGEYRTYMTNK